MKRKTTLLALPAIALAVIALLFLRRPPSVPPPVILHPTAQQAARAQRHMDALQQELQPEEPPQKSARPGRQQALPPAPPQPRTLRLSEEDLNVTLAGNQAARRLLAARGVKTVQIILSEPAHLTIRAAVSVKGHPQNVQLDGSLTRDPKLGLRYTVTRAQVGRFPLPPAVVTAQANALAARLAGRMRGHLPLAVQSVRVQGKTLVLTGLPVKRNPREQNRIRPPSPASPSPASPARR